MAHQKVLHQTPLKENKPIKPKIILLHDGECDKPIYPVTVFEAVFDRCGNSLADIIDKLLKDDKYESVLSKLQLLYKKYYDLQVAYATYTDEMKAYVSQLLQNIEISIDDIEDYLKKSTIINDINLKISNIEDTTKTAILSINEQISNLDGRVTKLEKTIEQLSTFESRIAALEEISITSSNTNLLSVEKDKDKFQFTLTPDITITAGNSNVTVNHTKGSNTWEISASITDTEGTTIVTEETLKDYLTKKEAQKTYLTIAYAEDNYYTKIGVLDYIKSLKYITEDTANSKYYLKTDGEALKEKIGTLTTTVNSKADKILYKDASASDNFTKVNNVKTFSMSPNIHYVLGTISESFALAYTNATDAFNNQADEYIIEFICGADGIEVTLPIYTSTDGETTRKCAWGRTPFFNANTRYLISIVNNIALFCAVNETDGPTSIVS